MSEQSRSVANDLLRLEMQLAMVGSQNGSGVNVNANPGAATEGGGVGGRSASRRPMVGVGGASTGGRSVGSSRGGIGAVRRSRITVHAPPGKLGIILANKADSKGTVVSGVRTTSPLADKITPGDRIVAIDGEDVTLMTVSEITTIMARKGDFDRTLTILTTPRHTTTTTTAPYGASSGMDPLHAPSEQSYHRSSYRN